LLEILACPIDKHTPLELFEINVILTNKVCHSVHGTDVTDTKSENDKPKVAENLIIK
jgi:uncharacterized protein YbaR (Trm112 family)